ncbi:MAG TPA: hypothetical protein EYO90_01065 [Candidatus Latescibacteria bacterium]|nr:hypothetical protein [Candidatus Latescibacterota bacterium]
MTVRQLLSHTAGLPAEVRLREQLAPEPLCPMSGDARDSVIKRLLASAPEYEPGTDVKYSDQGPILVGDLLEKLAGDSLDRLCEREIYSVFGLADTFFVHLDDPLPKARRPPESFAATEDCPWRDRVVVGQVHDENAYLLRGVAGHAGLFSTAADLSVLARMLLNPETAHGLSALGHGPPLHQEPARSARRSRRGLDESRCGRPVRRLLLSDGFWPHGLHGNVHLDRSGKGSLRHLPHEPDPPQSSEQRVSPISTSPSQHHCNSVGLALLGAL